MLIFLWVANALALLVTDFLLEGIRVGDFVTALFAAAVIGLLNTFLRPFLEFLALPINLLTFGLFSWVISALILILSSRFVPGFEVDGFIWALVGGILLSFIASLLQALVKR